MTHEWCSGGMPNADLTCVDTSAWIEYLRDSRHPVVQVTRELLVAARVCVADVVLGELFQGVRSPREQAIIEEFAQTLPILSGTPLTWKAAGQLAADARRHGKTLHLIDCYLASLVRERHAPFLTCDRHFEALQSLLPQLHIHLVSAT